VSVEVRELPPEETARHDPGFLTVSNLLSLSRIPLGVMFLLTSDAMVLAGVVFAGALTDLLDGFIARVSRTTSEVGILLDPFCDKIFVLLGVVSFLPGGKLDWAGFLILVLRDVFTGGSARGPRHGAPLAHGGEGDHLLPVEHPPRAHILAHVRSPLHSGRRDRIGVHDH
jgi:hypothetical protein